MQVEDRRLDARLGEHVVHLDAVVGLVGEEVRHQEVYGVHANPFLVIDVTYLTFQEPFLYAHREGLDACITITWFRAPWMLPKKAGLRTLRSASPRRAQASYGLRLAGPL